MLAADVLNGLKNVHLGDVQWFEFLQKVDVLHHKLPQEFDLFV